MGRNINAGPYDDFLQIDAPINPGNSGGPLFNQSGQVIGIDTAIYSPSGGSVGIGFAIPSNVAKNIVAQLREHGKVARGWLGVAMQPMPAALAKATGLANARRRAGGGDGEGSPAAHADVQQGDVILKAGDRPINEVHDLPRIVAASPIGQKLNLTIERDGKQMSLAPTIAQMPENQQQFAASGGEEEGAASACNSRRSPRSGASNSTSRRMSRA